MNGHEGDWLDQWVDEFLAATPPGWSFEDGVKLEVDPAA